MSSGDPLEICSCLSSVFRNGKRYTCALQLTPHSVCQETRGHIYVYIGLRLHTGSSFIVHFFLDSGHLSEVTGRRADARRLR